MFYLTLFVQLTSSHFEVVEAQAEVHHDGRAARYDGRLGERARRGTTESNKECAAAARTDILQVAASDSHLGNSQATTATQAQTLNTLNKTNITATLAASSEGVCYFPDKIPPELRNVIYHYLLPTDETFYHGYSDHVKPPPLLQVCRQIREEASAIYYAENEFVVFVRGFDSNKTFDLCQSALPYFPGFLKHAQHIRKSGGETSSDLREWLFRVHQGCVPCPPYGIPPSWVDQELTIVKHMTGVPWKVVEEVLDAHEECVQDLKKKCGRIDEQEWWQAEPKRFTKDIVDGEFLYIIEPLN